MICEFSQDFSGGPRPNHRCGASGPGGTRSPGSRIVPYCALDTPTVGPPGVVGYKTAIFGNCRIHDSCLEDGTSSALPCSHGTARHGGHTRYRCEHVPGCHRAKFTAVSTLRNCAGHRVCHSQVVHHSKLKPSRPVRGVACTRAVLRRYM